MPIKSDVVVKRFFDKGEELVGKVTNQVLSNEKFMAALQQTISKAIETKTKVDKNFQHALSTLNLPSTADLKKIEEKLVELEELLDGLGEKIGAIDKKLDTLSRGPKS
jgi:predicted nucleic-acid-binding protein